MCAARLAREREEKHNKEAKRQRRVHRTLIVNLNT